FVQILEDILVAVVVAERGFEIVAQKFFFLRIDQTAHPPEKPYLGGDSGPAQKLLYLEVEAEIGIGNRKRSREESGGVFQSLGQRIKVRDQLVRLKGRVAGEQFIPAIAAQRHLELFRGHFGEKVGWQNRGVGERLVQQAREHFQAFQHLRRAEYSQILLEIYGLGNFGGVLSFVKGNFIESDGKTFNVLVAALGQSRDEAGIDAAAQENSNGNVSRQSRCYRSL